MTQTVKTMILAALTLLATAAAALAGTIQVAVIPATISGDGDSFALGAEGKTTADLVFDLSMLPPGVTVSGAQLRLVPIGRGAGSQFVRIFETGKPGQSIGSLSVGPGEAPVLSSGNGIADRLMQGGGTLGLTLSTQSVRVDRSYASIKAKASSTRPRLIVEWNDTAPALTQQGARLTYRGAPDDVTPWTLIPVGGARLTGMFAARQILTGPVFVGADVIVIADDGQGPRLVGLNPLKGLSWRYPANQPLQAAPWKYLRVDARGRLLAFRNDGVVTVFDGFGAQGPTGMTDHAIPDLLVSKRPVVSAGGMIAFLGDQKPGDLGNHIYSYSPLPGALALWRSDQTVGKATAPVLSPRMGDHLVYAMVDGPDRGLAIFEAATGLLRFPVDGQGAGFPQGSDLDKFSQFHPVLPVAVPGANGAQEWAYLAGYGAQTGTLEGYADLTLPGRPAQWAAPQSGAMSRCVSPPVAEGDRPAVICVQDKGLRRYDFASGKELCRSDPASGDFVATSNLIGDGAGNVVFWQEDTASSGALHGFDSACQWQFSQPLDGIPARTDGIEVLELRIAPDGMIYLVSTTQLLAIRLMTPGDRRVTAMAAQTQYAASGVLSFAGAQAPAGGPIALYAADRLALAGLSISDGAQVFCTARNGIGFGPGFRVEKGGALRCGFDRFEAPN
ncbi:hypothetical protein [Tropicibacter oceani]|uniref:Uncharacterized protein n=1 Tax=Tropicibacter oceani TaxID=3058420 RepID=A0ABY8QE50_9RHOB|nr:hypothetical protein [Tropicibacter oceani]WGW02906.1 hypothetical protein QF118_13285 [Tropicibacter oceani]